MPLSVIIEYDFRKIIHQEDNNIMICLNIIEKDWNKVVINRNMISLETISAQNKFNSPKEVDDNIRKNLLKAEQDLEGCCAIYRDRYNLSKEEQIILQAFFGCFSSMFRADFESDGCISKLHTHIMEVLNKIICKMPLYEDNSLLFRCCHKEDAADFSVGDIYITRESLTASTLPSFRPQNDDWTTHKYVIYTQSKEKTRAHDMRVIKNDAYDGHIGECQINFEQGTKFLIIDTILKNGKKHIYMRELEYGLL